MEQAKKLGDKILNTKAALPDGIVKVINDGKCKVYYTSDDKPKTLDDIEKDFGGNDDLIIVIVEEPLKGAIYEYGNHGDYWELQGVTKGYA